MAVHAYDVIIIGAGPAGCAASISLSRARRHVLLIEAERFLRHRPGESLHPGIEPLFETLGVAQAVNEAGFIRHTGHHIRLHTEASERFEIFGKDNRGDWRGYQAVRPDLDRILLAEAIVQGTQLWQPCRPLRPVVKSGRVVGLETCRGTVNARFVVDATGKNHWLTRKLGIPWSTHSPKLVARYGYVRCQAGQNTRFANPLMQYDAHGWTWIAKVRAKRHAWVRMQFDGSDPGHTWIPPELAHDTQEHMRGGADVTWRIATKLAGPGWFLIGDAAAILDPSSSHGVLRAIMTGMMAANEINSMMDNPRHENESINQYHEWLAGWFLQDANALDELYKMSSVGVGLKRPVMHI